MRRVKDHAALAKLARNKKMEVEGRNGERVRYVPMGDAPAPKPAAKPAPDRMAVAVALLASAVKSGAKATEEAGRLVAAAQETGNALLAALVQEEQKPEPPKRWKFTVHRSTHGGPITEIDAEQVA